MAVNIGVNIQRKRGVTSGAGSVGGSYPDLLLDVPQDYYRANGGSKAFADVVTHSRSGNATMVDGYGPELVTNGTFDSNVDGWTVEGGTASVNDGRLFVTAGAGGFVYVSQSFATEVGVRYILTLNLDTVTSTHNYVALGTTSNNLAYSYVNAGTGKQSYEVTFTATETTSVIKFSTGIGSGLSSFWDNVSVREMPVLKWAPHNLVKYSEDFSAGLWSAVNATKSGTVTDPFGGTTATTITATAANGQILQAFGGSAGTSATYTSKLYVRRRTGSGTVFLFNPNGGGITAISSLTSDWQEFTIIGAGGVSTNYIGIRLSTSGDAVDVAFASFYRSDLGGMADNPDQPTGFESYVPTTSSAVYLPRRGHYVYNGSAWVNEGLLHESEARTNLETYSDILDAQWTKTELSILEDQAVSPSGLEDASLVKESAALGTHRAIGNFAPVIGTTYTFSVYAKKKERTIFSIGGAGLYNSNELPEFDVDNGIAYNGGTGNATVNIQDVGNGWYRCSVTFTATGTSPFIVQLHDSLINSTPPSGTGVSYTGDGTSGMYFWGAQTEAGSTPSSYIPTAGATVTRAAETLTIPSAKLPWPTPQIIGDELVTNGTFDTDVSGWTALNSGILSWDNSGAAKVVRNGSNDFGVRQTISGLQVGSVYRVIGSVSGDVTGLYYKLNGVAKGFVPLQSTNTVFFVAASTSVTFDVIAYGGYVDGQFGLFDNISVREINPLSVSIQMDGRVTYADTNAVTEAALFRWYSDSSNYILPRLNTAGGTGKLSWLQVASGTLDFVETGGSYFTPGILVPFDIASRHGSTFINGAVDGVALTADTTPTALPDLSATDLELGYDYMGTIARFRVWDVDLGDTGIEAATAPSLEPSLSLTFDSTEGSFTVDDWRA